MLVFCTLFNSNYLDKGIALYESLCNVEDDFKLYVFAFDQKVYDILLSLNFKKIKLVSLQEFESEKMLEVKKTRSLAEYCWTCTPLTIDYVLTTFHEPQCTYLDADLYFFSSPKALLNELQEAKKSVLITEHRFPAAEQERMIERAGKYCVQFNTFINDKQGKEVLKSWAEQCLDWCYYTPGEEKMGDQKYLETWTSEYTCVHELQHMGGGVAPWNVSEYILLDEKNMIFSYKNLPVQLVFYHFQNIRYLPFSLINIRSSTKDKRVKYSIYYPYLIHIERIRKSLHEEFNVSFSIKKSYYQSFILRLIQNYIMPFKVSCLSDIISLKNIRKYL